MNPQISIDTPPHIDVCILCALPQEAQMLKEVFKSQLNIDFQRKRSTHLKREYDYTSISNVAGEPLNILVTWLAYYGPVETSLQLRPLLEEFKPRFAAMTGICAGDKKKVKLGDIVVAERAFLYETGKVVSGEDGHKELLRDTQTWSPPLEVIHFARGFNNWSQAVNKEKRPVSRHQQRDWLLDKLLDPQTPRIDDISVEDLDKNAPEWRRIVQSLRSGSDVYLTSDRRLNDRSKVDDLRYGLEIFPFKDAPEPTVYITPMASGSAVRSDTPFKDISVPVRDTLAIDMEGATFYRTLAEFQDTHCLIVKGVCDYADSEKDDSYHNYAARVSSLYLLTFIHEYVTSNRLPALPQGNTKEAQGQKPIAPPASTTEVQAARQASTQEQQSGLNLFYSYAPEDEVLRKELAKHLVMLQRQGWINQVHDAHVGASREEETRNRLQQAQIILLLISPDLLASDLYEKELVPALDMRKDEKVRIVPILLRTTGGWEDSDLGKLVILPRNNKPIVEWRSRDTAFAEVAKEIREIVKQLRATSSQS